MALGPAFPPMWSCFSSDAMPGDLAVRMDHHAGPDSLLKHVPITGRGTHENTRRNRL